MSLGLDPFAGKLRTGTAVMEFVAAPMRQRERSSYADGGKFGGQGRSAGWRPNCVSKGSEFETCGRKTVPCYQF
jgi:hypothetical protein